MVHAWAIVPTQDIVHTQGIVYAWAIVHTWDIVHVWTIVHTWGLIVYYRAGLVFWINGLEWADPTICGVPRSSADPSLNRAVIG
jgi:hypothetical protein